MYVALLACLTFTVPYLAYHATNPPPDSSGGAQLINVLTLGSGVAMALLLGWGTRSRTSR